MLPQLSTPDPAIYSDLISQLGAICQLPPRSPQKTVRMRQVVQILEAHGALSFNANNGSLMFPGQVGRYVTAQIPITKTGHLKPLRGRHALVVCVGSGSNRTRQYMALPVR